LYDLSESVDLYPTAIQPELSLATAALSVATACAPSESGRNADCFTAIAESALLTQHLLGKYQLGAELFSDWPEITRFVCMNGKIAQGQWWGNQYSTSGRWLPIDGS
jgi:hypothetical protein